MRVILAQGPCKSSLYRSNFIVRQVVHQLCACCSGTCDNLAHFEDDDNTFHFPCHCHTLQKPARQKPKYNLHLQATPITLITPHVPVKNVPRVGTCLTYPGNPMVCAEDTLAEQLRCRPAKPMGSPRVGSNPTGVDLSGFEEKKNMRYPERTTSEDKLQPSPCLSLSTGACSGPITRKLTAPSALPSRTPRPVLGGLSTA